MSNPFQNLKETHKVQLQMLGIFALSIALYGGLTAIYFVLNSNTLYQKMVITVILYEVLEYFGYIMFWFAFSFLFLFQEREKRAGIIVLWYIPTSIFYYGIAFLIQILLFGKPEGQYILTYFLNITMDMIQMLIAFLIVNLLLKKEGKDKLTMLLLACIPSVFRIGIRVYYDIRLGLPQTGTEIVTMIIYYLADLFLAALGYYIIRLIVLHIRNRVTGKP